MRFTTTTLATTIGVLALTVASCGGSADQPATDSAATTPSTGQVTPTTETDIPVETDGVAEVSGAANVGILNSRFDPLEITIAVGDTVEFTNSDPFAHTVTSKDDVAMSFASGELGQDEMFGVQFDEAGTFAYFCEIHPTMRATVVVG